MRTPEPTLARYCRENAKRSIRDWDGREIVIGLFVILGTALGYGIYVQNPEMSKGVATVAVVYVGFLFLVASPWQMWRDSQRKVVGFEEALEPRLSFVFHPDIPPYLQNFGLGEDGELQQIVRLYRIGIRNDSAAIIRRVRVVIESIEHTSEGVLQTPNPNQSGLIEHALNVMGIDSKDGRVDLSPGDRPTAYFDVVEQRETVHQQPNPYMSPCYATRHRTPVSVVRSRWVFRLRVEGGRTYCRASVAIETGVDGRIVMTPYSFD